MSKLENNLSYTKLSFFILAIHIAMIVTVVAKGTFTLVPLLFLAGMIIFSDVIYFNIIQRLKQDTYTLDFFLVLILNMSVIFQSCFGEVAFNVKHFITCAVGFVICQLGFKLVRNYAVIESRKKYIYIAIGVLVLLILLCTGSRSMWIDFGFFTIQPSEFIKPLFVLVCASSLTALQNKVTVLGVKFVPDSMILLGVTIGIVALQWWCRDLGSLPTFCAAAGCAFVLRLSYPKAKFSKKNVAIIGSVLLLLVIIAVAFAPSYVKDRLYVDIWADQSGDGYQQCKALIAIAEGGWFGKGPANGDLYKVAAYDTDIVFSSISEEWGLLMAIFSVTLIILMLLMMILNHPRSFYHSTLAVCITAMFITQMALNIFGSCNLIPFTGVTIPFISNGGSSMVSSCFMIGMLKATQSPVYTLPPSKFMKKNKKKGVKADEKS